MVCRGNAATISSSRVRSTLASLPRGELLSVAGLPFVPAGVKQSPQTRVSLAPGKSITAKAGPTTPARMRNLPAAALARFSLRHDGLPESRVVAQLHRYRTVADLERIPAGAAEIENVFFGTNHAVGLGIQGVAFDFFDVRRNVTVVVGKKSLADDMKAPGSQIGDECVRVANSAESEKLPRSGLGIFLARIFSAQNANCL